MTTTLLPNLKTAQAAKGSASNDPKGRPNNKVPSCPSVNVYFIWKSGILEAQEEKPSPAKKKNTPADNRCFFNWFIMDFKMKVQS